MAFASITSTAALRAPPANRANRRVLAAAVPARESAVAPLAPAPAATSAPATVPTSKDAAPPRVRLLPTLAPADTIPLFFSIVAFAFSDSGIGSASKTSVRI